MVSDAASVLLVGVPRDLEETTAGPVQLARPKFRGTTEAFASRLFGAHVTKTNALESLVIASFVRGLLVRDVEAALAESLGDQAVISKSTVSVVCQQIKDEYDKWAQCRLDDVVLDYLLLDASFFLMHPAPTSCGAGWGRRSGWPRTSSTASSTGSGYQCSVCQLAQGDLHADQTG